RTGPRIVAGLDVLRMEKRLPVGEAAMLFRNKPREFIPARIEIIQIAIPARCPNHLGHGVGELPEPLLARAQVFLGRFSGRNVAIREKAFGRSAVRIELDKPLTFDPALEPIVAQNAVMKAGNGPASG